MDKRIGAAILIFIAALFWGIEPILSRDHLGGMHAIAAIFWGHLLGLFLFVPFLFRQGNLGFHRVKMKFVPALLVIGIAGEVIAGLLFASSFEQVGAATSTFMLMLRPFCVLAFSSLLLGERRNSRFLIWAVWVLLGAITIFTFDETFSLKSFSIPGYRNGFALGLLAIGLWSLSTVSAKWVLPKISAHTLLFIRWSLSLVGFFFVMILQKVEFFPSALFDGKIILLLALSTVVLGLIPIFIYYRGLAILPASLTSFVELTCPLAVVFIPATFQVSVLHDMQWIGGFSIVAGVILLLQMEIEDFSAGSQHNHP